MRGKKMFCPLPALTEIAKGEREREQDGGLGIAGYVEVTWGTSRGGVESGRGF